MRRERIDSGGIQDFSNQNTLLFCFSFFKKQFKVTGTKQKTKENKTENEQGRSRCYESLSSDNENSFTVTPTMDNTNPYLTLLFHYLRNSSTSWCLHMQENPRILITVKGLSMCLSRRHVRKRKESLIRISLI